MLEMFEESVWASLALAFIISLDVGGVLSFSAWQNEIKDAYLLSQTQGITFGRYHNLFV